MVFAIPERGRVKTLKVASVRGDERSAVVACKLEVVLVRPPAHTRLMRRQHVELRITQRRHNCIRLESSSK